MNEPKPTEEENKKSDEQLELQVEDGNEEHAPNEFDEDRECAQQPLENEFIHE